MEGLDVVAIQTLKGRVRDYLQELGRAIEAGRQARAELPGVLRGGREIGLSVTEMASLAGIARQEAHRRMADQP